jgi:uncharacterized membrane protein
MAGSRAIQKSAPVEMKRPNPYFRSTVTAPRTFRIVLGLALVAGGVLGFLPILGFWMIPLGLLVMFFDVPWVRERWRRGRAWLKRRRGQGGGRRP